MSRLRVLLHGKMIFDINLVEDQIYIAGRKEGCEILLQPEKGISREHFKLSFVNNEWQVDVISRYGEIIFNGEKPQSFVLSESARFLVPPYEFEFQNLANEVPLAPTVSPRSDFLPTVTPSHDVENFEGNVEKTVVGVAPTTAYLKFVDANNAELELVRLDTGDTWIAGREPTCHIQIKDQRVSRRQFEIRRAGLSYAILDLGSVNGTLVNGSAISSSEPTQLKSGDSVSVLSNYMVFELHDVHFRSRLDLVKIDAPRALVTKSEVPMPTEFGYNAGGGAPPAVLHPYGFVPPEDSQLSGNSPGFDFAKFRPLFIAIAALILIFAVIFSGEKQSPGPQIPAGGTNLAVAGSPQEAFGKLTQEQQALVKQRYKDTKNLYMQGKYQLAIDEIVKIKSLVPEYEDIRDIEQYAKEALFIQAEQARQDQIEKDKIEIEDKIQRQTDICQRLVNPEIRPAEMEDCLSSVLQFNPDHPRILSLKSQVESIVSQRQVQATERAARQAEVAKLRAIYERAQKVQRTGKPLDAISAFEKVMQSGLPDPNGLKGQSQREIANIKNKMNQKTSELQAEAKRAYEGRNLRDAILALRKARALDPTNPEIPETIEHYTLELRKSMMEIYQEGILEESFGNVEGGESKAGAKEKWKKILSLDLPDGEYYKKAYIKLKKYGAL